MEVITRVEDGEFASFVRENTATLLRTAYLLTGEGGAAEELVQDTLVRLYAKGDRLLTADAPVAYARRSIVNAFVNARRGFVGHEATVPVVPEQNASPSDADQVADRDEMWFWLRELPERQRAALVLRYYHDLPDGEIASALGCRSGTVRSLLSRGLAALREGAEAQT